MRILLISLTLLLTLPSSSFAQDSFCANAYGKQAKRFLTEITNLKSLNKNLDYATVAGIGGMGVCLSTAKSWLACGILIAPFIAGTSAYNYYTSNRIHKLEDAFKIYQVYEYIAKEDYESEPVQRLLKEVNVSPSQQFVAIAELKRLMESGELCSNRRPAKSWAEVLYLLRLRLAEKMT